MASLFRTLTYLCFLLACILPGKELQADAVREFFRYYPQWRERSNWQQVLEKGQAAIDLCQKRRHFEDEALIRTRVGVSHVYLGDPDRAERQARASLDIAETHHYSLVEVRSLGLLSSIYRLRASHSTSQDEKQKFFVQAESFALSALKLYADAGLQIQSLKAKILCELSSLYVDRVDERLSSDVLSENCLADLAKAKTGFEEAMELFLERNLVNDYHSAAVRYGQTLLRMGKVSESREILEKLGSQISRPRTRYHWESLKAQVEAAEGKPLKALQTAAVARSRAKELGARDDAKRLKVFIKQIKAGLNKAAKPCAACGEAHGVA